jgi:flap endonuclease-1
VPCIQAASEAEAQAARYVREGYAYAVVSQDADCLLFGAPRMIKNLSITGRRKKPGTPIYYTVEPELIELNEVLEANNLTQEQLITLGMLVGTDFNPGGIKGIGPKKALKLVHEHATPAEVFAAANWDEHQPVPWQEIHELLTHMPTNKPEEIVWGRLDRSALEKLLFSRGFSKERLNVLDKLGERQQGLGEFFG